MYTSSLKLALRSPVIQSVVLVSADDTRETALRSNCVCKVLNDRRKAVRFCKEVSPNSNLNRSMTSSSVTLRLPLIYSHSMFINTEYRGSPSGVTRFMYNVPFSLYRYAGVPGSTVNTSGHKEQRPPPVTSISKGAYLFSQGACLLSKGAYPFGQGAYSFSKEAYSFSKKAY